MTAIDYERNQDSKSSKPIESNSDRGEIGTYIGMLNFSQR